MITQIQGRARKEESYTSNEYPNSGLSQKRGIIHTQCVPKFRIEPEKRNHTHPMSTQIQGRARKEDSLNGSPVKAKSAFSVGSLSAVELPSRLRISYCPAPSPNSSARTNSPKKSKPDFSGEFLSVCRS
jgi:hypothetical protein